MAHYISYGMLTVLVDRSKENYPMHFSKKVLNHNGKPIGESWRRKFRMLADIGLMIVENRGTDWVYRVSPKGLAVADTLKLTILSRSQ